MITQRWIMNQLEKARAKIDSIDRELARLYEERMKTLQDVAAYKQAHGLAVVDTSREEAIVQKNRKFITDPAFVDSYERVLRFMISESCDYQRVLLAKGKVGYAGIEGAFSHMVAKRLFHHHTLVAYSNFEDVFQALVDKKIEFGVIPFENTNSGLVGEVLDALLKYPVFIEQVWDQKIEQCLLGIEGATLKDIEWVYSKDQALNQSREFIQSLNAQPVAYPNTALAAQYVAMQRDKTKAAIGAKENAALYNLNILASRIEENSENTTRFLVISRERNQEGDRFAMCVTFKNEVGALGRVIEEISRQHLNMCSIQSRPLKGHSFEYFFFIEIEGNVDQRALDAIRSVCDQTKVLGSYTMRKENNE